MANPGFSNPLAVVVVTIKINTTTILKNGDNLDANILMFSQGTTKQLNGSEVYTTGIIV